MSDSPSFIYTINEEECARAMRAHTRIQQPIWVMWIVFGIFSAYAILVGLFAVGQGGKTWLSLGQSVLGFAVGGALLWCFYWFLPGLLMRGSPSVGVEEEIILLDDRIVIQSRLGRDDLFWAHFKKVDETREFFLLHPHEGNFYPFPKRYFANSVELGRFRQRIRKNIPDFHEY